LSAQRICLGLIFLTQALYGIAVSLSPTQNEALALTNALVTTSLVFFWCRLDAAARKVSFPPWNQILVIVVALVGVPVYFFRTRSRREAVLASLKATGVLVAGSIVSGATSVITRAIAT
jgi:phosphoglycerol transferase MdoB-like AlkP superfamily enzyme